MVLARALPEVNAFNVSRSDDVLHCTLIHTAAEIKAVGLFSLTC